MPLPLALLLAPTSPPAHQAPPVHQATTDGLLRALIITLGVLALLYLIGLFGRRRPRDN